MLRTVRGGLRRLPGAFHETHRRSLAPAVAPRAWGVAGRGRASTMQGMPPRPILPSDDLYLRLELPADATPEAIELAWRALLRRHHPDIAGPAGLEVSKRINVAHDWLSDPGLRARYDRDRGVPGAATRRRAAGGSWHHSQAHAARASIRHRARRADDQIARFLDRVSGLTSDELDRLEAADPAPIAFGATIRQFIPDNGRAALASVEAEIARRLSPLAATRPRIHDTIDAYAVELVLGSFLDDLLSEPFRARARERLTRGWEAAVGQPRYGPNGTAITELLGRLRVLDTAGILALAARGGRARIRRGPMAAGSVPRGRRSPARLVGPGSSRCDRCDRFRRHPAIRCGNQSRPPDHHSSGTGRDQDRSPSRTPPRVCASDVRSAHRAVATGPHPGRSSDPARSTTRAQIGGRPPNTGSRHVTGHAHAETGGTPTQRRALPT